MVGFCLVSWGIYIWLGCLFFIFFLNFGLLHIPSYRKRKSVAFEQYSACGRDECIIYIYTHISLFLLDVNRKFGLSSVISWCKILTVSIHSSPLSPTPPLFSISDVMINLSLSLGFGSQEGLSSPSSNYCNSEAELGAYSKISLCNNATPALPRQWLLPFEHVELMGRDTRKTPSPGLDAFTPKFFDQ